VDGVFGNDLVAVSKAGGAFVYGGTGSGGFGARTTISTDWAAGDRIITLGDFTGDGYADLGRINAAGEFYLYAGKAGGGFIAPVRIGYGWSPFTHVVGGIDFDGDRRTDVVAVDSSGLMRLYRGDGRGGWAPAGGAQIGSGWSIAQQVFHLGDFNGDGKSELGVV